MAEREITVHSKNTQHVIAKYLDYALYNFFRGRFHLMMSEKQVAKEGLVKETWEGIFFAPQDIMKRRSALLKGLPHPLVCFWRSGSLIVEKGFYGHSVMNRNFEWKYKEPDSVNPGQTKLVSRASSGRLVHYSATYNLFAESYYLNFINQFSNDMMELDFQRYIDFWFEGYLDSYRTKVEFILQTNKTDAQMDDDKQTRAFTATTEWQVSMMVPQIRDGVFLEQVRLWLDKQSVLTVNPKRPEVPDPIEIGE